MVTDESCCIASGGKLKVLGDKLKRKHEHNSGDSRVSMTMIRTGSVSGATGPTTFLLAGLKVKTGYTDAFLVRHGCHPGSSCNMTPTAFCTTEVWKEIALKRAKSIRNMDPVIKAHPNWYCIEILDGFAAHFNSPEALQIYYDHKIIQVKEEGDSSQVNQTYDQCVARQDKRENNLGLSLARHAAVATRGVVDQWDLVDIALMAVREGVRNPSLWVNSAIKVNLHPFHRKSFPEWLEKIRFFLQDRQSFKLGQ